MKNYTENFSSELDLLVTNATVHCMDVNQTIIKNGAVGMVNDKIVWVGQSKNQPKSKKIIDAYGNLLTPGLVDCHTHVVYSGQRSEEFAMRQAGKSYQEIASAGGGILSTVESVHKSNTHQLFLEAKQRIDDMMAFGVTTIECKSGYGLDLDNELKLLNVIDRLAQTLAIRVHPTFLALHALPKTFQKKQDAYVDKVIFQFLPKLIEKTSIKSVDAYCESFAFSLEQVKNLFLASKALGLDIRLHAEQFSNQQGAKLAASLGALSVDHLEYLEPGDCKYLVNTVAVLLPGAYYFLKETKVPPIQELRLQKVSIAIATDCNPGTSPFLSLPLMMNMACVLFGLTIEEAWLGVTRNSAQALGMLNQIGTIELQKKADLVIWSTDSLVEIIYQPNHNFCQTVIFNGKIRND